MERHPESRSAPMKTPDEPKAKVSRRNFLKGSVASAVAASAIGAEKYIPGVGENGPTHLLAAPTTASSAAPMAQNGTSSGPPPLALSDLTETWQQSWAWRPSDWPGEQLHLNVVENENPGLYVGAGNQGAVLFSYGGNTPGPTIRMRGDETLYIKLRNMLGQDFGKTAIGPAPDPNELVPGLDYKADVEPKLTIRPDYCLGEHANGQHAARVTNLHVHGLHVRPGLNPDGTHSDNVILRVLNKGDFVQRQALAQHPDCDFLEDLIHSGFLRDDEVVGEANYEFRLGDVFGDPNQPHPPGTHWYHPHSHGSTHNQVASGMAGFLIIEGDVDDNIDLFMSGLLNGSSPTMAPADLSFTDERADALAEIRATNPNMELKMGPYDYRERLIFAQSVLALRSEDKDAPPQSQQLKSPPKAAVNGSPNPMLIHMRPGAVERWRILNGSVDGRGYKRFMVLEGQLVLDPSNNNQLTAITELGTETTYTPVPLARTPENSIDFEDLKQPLYLLAFDGVTLVASDGDGGWQYAIKDLSNQGSGRANPLTESNTLENPNAAMQERIANCYKDADSIKGAFVRPNEVYLAPANRADLFFQAPTGTLDPFTVTISDPTENLPQSDSAAATQGFIDAFASTDTLIGEEETQITVIQTDRHKNPTEWRIDNPISFEQDSIVAPSETYLLKPGDNKDEFIVTQVQIYTIVAKSSLVAGDNYQSTLQEKAAAGTTTFASPPQDIVLAHIVVSGSSLTDDSEQPLINVMTLNDILPPVPPYHLPIQDAELAITDEEADARSDVTAGNYRTRTVTYSGWGSADYPLITTATPDRTGANFREFVGQDKDHDRNTIGKLENIVYAQPKDKDGKGIVDDEGEPIYVLMPSAIRSMAIDGRKFNPNDTLRPRMLLDSAEEWALYNDSIMLWGNTASQPPGHYGDHHVGYPITRKEGQEAFNRDAELQIVARAIDHPFHIHQNPFWVISVEIPDENGDLHNILEEPRWQDVVWIPRNGGRVVFRSRFPDYVGRYVNHCHILLHEDNGMMTAIEATPYMDQTNYVGRSSVASVADGTPPTSDVINQVYTPPTLEEAYVQSMQFEDNNPHRSQVYPGFDVEPPQ